MKTLREHLSAPILENFVLGVKGPIPLQALAMYPRCSSQAYLYPKTKIIKMVSPISVPGAAVTSYQKLSS